MNPDASGRWIAARDPEQYGELVSRTAGGQRPPGHFVVLAMQFDAPTAEQIEGFAQIAELDEWSARQRLMTPCPRILRREATRAAADQHVGELRDAGLRAFTVSEERIASFQPLEPESWRLGAEAIRFLGEDGTTIARVAPGQILCLVEGTVHQRAVRHSHTREAAVAGRTAAETLKHQVETVIDIHPAGEERPVRLREARLHLNDMLITDADMPVAPMGEVLRLLQKAAPGARLFDSFEAAAGALADSGRIVARFLDYGRLPGVSAWSSRALTRNQVFEEHEGGAFDLYSILSAVQVARG